MVHIQNISHVGPISGVDRGHKTMKKVYMNMSYLTLFQNYSHFNLQLFTFREGARNGYPLYASCSRRIRELHTHKERERENRTRARNRVRSCKSM